MLFEDLKDDLLLIPRKDLFPTKYQAFIDLLLAAAMTDMRTQEIEHPLTFAVNTMCSPMFGTRAGSSPKLSARTSLEAFTLPSILMFRISVTCVNFKPPSACSSYGSIASCSGVHFRSRATIPRLLEDIHSKQQSVD